MPTRSQSSLFVLSEKVSSLLGEDLRVWAQMMEMSLSARHEHNAPNLAVLLMVVRKSRNVSQMELGTNRTRKDNKVIFDSVESIVSGLSQKSGFFSMIANVEQGGRKTDVSPAFLQFVAKVTNLPESVVTAANAEDAAIRASFAKANKPK